MYRKIVVSFLAVLIFISSFSIPTNISAGVIDISPHHVRTIYIEEFIERYIESQVSRVNPTLAYPNYIVNYQALRERLRERPYITWFRTYTTSLIFGFSFTHEYWFQAHPTFTSVNPIIDNARDRSDSGLLLNVPNSSNSVVGRIRFRTQGSHSYLAIVGNHSSLNQTIQFTGRVTHVAQLKVVFDPAEHEPYYRATRFSITA